MALSNLSHKEALCERLFKMRPVPHLISMAAKRDETLRRGCASIFCNLTAMKGSEKQLLKAEVVASLLVIAMIASDQTVAKTICVKALVNLMAERDAFPQLAKEGVIWCMSSLALDKVRVDYARTPLLYDATLLIYVPTAPPAHCARPRRIWCCRCSA